MPSYSDNDSTNNYMEKVLRKRLPLNDYLYYIRRFVEMGDVLEIEKDVAIEFAWELYDDPILRYLSKLMSDPIIQAAVLSSKLAGQVFYETVGRFVAECLHTEEFINQRFFTERKEAGKTTEWSMGKRQDNWQTLLAAIDEKHRDDGFDINFMKKRFQYDGWKNPENWETLQREWMAAIDNRVRKEVTKKIEAKEAGAGGGFNRIFERLSHQMRSQGITEAEALQAWNMMAVKYVAWV